MAKKMIIKGVGNFLAKRYNEALGGEEVLTLGSLQDLKITLNVEIEDIFGGDGIYAIDTLVKSKSIEVTATDAKFDLNALTLMMGDSGSDFATADKYLWVLNEQATVGVTAKEIQQLVIYTTPTADDLALTTITLNGVAYTIQLLSTDSQEDVATKISQIAGITALFVTSVVGDVVTFTSKANGDMVGAFSISGNDVTGAFTTIKDGASTSGKVMLLNTPATNPSITVRNKATNAIITAFTQLGNELTFTGVADATDVLINYKRVENSLTVNDFYSILSDGVPFNVHVIHNGVYLQKDNTKAGIETELYQCRAKGTFSIDAARAQASTSNISLTVLDPERSDKRLGTIKRFTM